MTNNDIRTALTSLRDAIRNAASFGNELLPDTRRALLELNRALVSELTGPIVDLDTKVVTKKMPAKTVVPKRAVPSVPTQKVPSAPKQKVPSAPKQKVPSAPKQKKHDMVTVAEAAELLGVSEPTVRRMLSRRDLTHVKVSARKTMIPVSEIKTYLEDNTVNRVF
jgi:excisionase family DNA binding protein